MKFSKQSGELDPNLVFEFFWKFSTFECALKREGFLKPGRNSTAIPDWGCFGRRIRGQFAKVSISGFENAVNTLKHLAPRRQVVRNGQLGWEAVYRKDDESDEEFILRLLKTARNNLFHGGKYPDGPVDEIARDQNILQAALTILNVCFEIHPGVKRWIDEAAQQSDSADGLWLPLIAKTLDENQK